MKYQGENRSLELWNIKVKKTKIDTQPTYLTKHRYQEEVGFILYTYTYWRV